VTNINNITIASNPNITVVAPSERGPSNTPFNPAFQSQCLFQGAYRIINAGRKPCSGRLGAPAPPVQCLRCIFANLDASLPSSHPPLAEYLVYYGGNAARCKDNRAVLARSGSFNTRRTSWLLSVSSFTGTTPLIAVRSDTLLSCADICPARRDDTHSRTLPFQAKRECPAGVANSLRSSGSGVVLGSAAGSWEILPADASCGTVHIRDRNRFLAASPSYLSASVNCASKTLIFASKDSASLRQRWLLKKS
jgi:hypothetical protein